MNDSVFAVDLGGTNIRMAAVASDGTIQKHTRRPTPKGAPPAQFVEIFAQMMGECSDESTRGVAVSLGVPANVTAEGVVRHLPNIPSLDGFDLRPHLSERVGLPVYLENDATAAAIGENWMGASKGVDNSIMITLGTGVGGGVFVDGKPLRGPDGGAGKLGHICVEPDGHPCGCGSHGCIEQYASASALKRMAKEAGLPFENSFELYNAAIGGDATAQGVFNKMGRYLGITLAGLVNTFNPDIIVIGGGAAAGWDAFVEPLNTEIKYRAFCEPANRAKVVRGQLADNAGILGVARLAFLSAAN